MAEEDYTDWRDDPELPQKMEKYDFNVNATGVVCALDKKGGVVKWPAKSNRLEVRKDPSRWCGFMQI